uniref:HAD family hydrolase n=1 Tax=Gemmiger formicilis TaxID=745368 RepID=UPI003FF0839C
MRYKVLALDLDGTLTNTEKVITPRTKAALQEAARRGVCIVLLLCASLFCDWA